MILGVQRRLALLFACLLVPTLAVAQTTQDCSHLVPFGQPVHHSLPNAAGIAYKPHWTLICHTGQFVALNSAHNVADWAAHRLRRDELLAPAPGVKRKDNFRPDPLAPAAHQVVSDDYLKTGYDRGHLAPAAAMKWSRQAMDDSFFMTNMAPQVGSGFNQHIWKSLEANMRRWACARGELFVVTGPLYEDEPIPQLISDDNGDGEDDNGILVDVPSHFFKLALDPLRMEVIAFILPNQKLTTRDLPKYLVSIAEIEARSQLDFLSEIWNGAEHAIESHKQPALWPKPDESDCGALK